MRVQITATAKTSRIRHASIDFWKLHHQQHAMSNSLLFLGRAVARPQFLASAPLSASAFSRSSLRSFSYTSPVSQEATKVPIKLIAELRKHNPVSLTKAKQALAACENSVSAALEWLQKDLASSGLAKVAKLSSKSAKEGLIGVSLMGTRASMVELRCETDFVARAEVFRALTAGVAQTAAFLDLPGSSAASSEDSAVESSPSSISSAIDSLVSFPINELLGAPLIPSKDSISMDGSQDNKPLPSTIQDAITSAVTQTGENIQLHRVISFASPMPLTADPLDSASAGTNQPKQEPFLLPGVYVHGAVPGGSGNEGTVGGLVILSTVSTSGENILNRITKDTSIGGDLQSLARSLARQVVAFPTKAISRPTSSENGSSPTSAAVEEGEEAAEYLLEQPFMMYKGEQRPVREVLKEWGEKRGLELDVRAMKRWAVGEDA